MLDNLCIHQKHIAYPPAAAGAARRHGRRPDPLHVGGRAGKAGEHPWPSGGGRRMAWTRARRRWVWALALVLVAARFPYRGPPARAHAARHLQRASQGLRGPAGSDRCARRHRQLPHPQSGPDHPRAHRRTNRPLPLTSCRCRRRADGRRRGPRHQVSRGGRWARHRRPRDPGPGPSARPLRLVLQPGGPLPGGMYEALTVR